jgi:hypothetical protein
VASYSQQMQDIFRRYQEEISRDPVDLMVVGAWAIANRLWAPRPIDVQTRFASDMADALREEYRTDKKGRRYRAKLAVAVSGNGRQGALWGDIDTAPRTHVVKSVGQRRKAIVHDCHALRLEVDHYNEAHPAEEPIQLLLDFEEDVEEMLVAAGLKKGEAA